MKRTALMVTALAILAPWAVEAQSLFSAGGLGFPVEALKRD